MRVKLVTLWIGPLPEWLPQFSERMDRNSYDWELLHFNSVDDVNELATKVLGTPCRKGSAYSLCDLRPMFGELFQDRLQGYDFWGWCDLDVVLGDLDRLLTPLLLRYDIVTTDTWTVNGALTLLLNIPDVNTLWRRAYYRKILEEPDYCNFDESGFNDRLRMEAGMTNANQHFTRLIKESGLIVHWDNRSWVESSETIDVEGGIPSRWCEVQGNKLLETPTGRELVLYHFTNRWPLPDPYPERQRYRRLALGRTIPRIDSHQWWIDKVEEVADRPLEELKHPGYDISQEAWEAFQNGTAEIFRKVMDRKSKVLDVGCGFGALRDCLGRANFLLRYSGIDFSPEVINLAVNRGFSCRSGNIYQKQFPYVDKAFDWCVCRGLEGPVLTQLGMTTWKRMVAEMRRVAHKVLVINLLNEYRIIEGS